jgi:Tfp pilus assembly protein FimT
MTPETRSEPTFATCSAGYTIIQLLIVLTMVGIIVAIAAPSIRSWRPALDAKQTSATLVNTLREARSKALTLNYQHKVDFDVPNRKYRMQSGSQAYNNYSTPLTASTATWVNVPGYDWTTLSSGVTISSGIGNSCNSSANVDVQFNANGTARLESPWGSQGKSGPLTVCIQGGTGAVTYRVIVSPAGLVTLQYP